MSRFRPVIVCHCRAITDRDIRDSVRSGLTDLTAVAEATGAGSCCGGCLPSVDEVVSGELRAKDAPAQVRSSGPRPLRLVSSRERAA